MDEKVKSLTTSNDMSSSMQSRRLDTSQVDFECYQNYTAPEVFVQGLAGMVNQSDISTIIGAQKQMLQRFEKTNEMLSNCNALSASRLKTSSEEFKRHVKQLNDMKKDIEYIFKKIRNVKSKLATQYPEAMAQMHAQEKLLQSNLDEDDEEIVVAKEALGPPSNQPTPKKQPPTAERCETKEVETVKYVKFEQSPENGSQLGTTDQNKPSCSTSSDSSTSSSE